MGKFVAYLTEEKKQFFVTKSIKYKNLGKEGQPGYMKSQKTELVWNSRFYT